MKFRMLVLILLLATPAFAQQLPVPEIRYESVSNPLRLPPHLYLGEAAGVAVNSKGHIFVYSRGGHTHRPLAPHWDILCLCNSIGVLC
jgi:hypothetical protein